MYFNPKKQILNSLSLILSLSIASSNFAFAANPIEPTLSPPAWEYNPGPDPLTKEGRAFIDLYATLPEYMSMSDALMDKQKFRYIFGMMLTRTYFEPNSVKILFIGQDATHIAEAAKQPGTSGFGGRVQSIGNYFGVDQGISTTNAYLSTIKGQYGSFGHPIVELDASGKPRIRQTSFVDNNLWMLTNGRESEVLRKREEFWELMIKNNDQSLDMMTVFGGAARDSFAEFLIGRGATVGTETSVDRLKVIQVPKTILVNAGGNNEFPVPVDKNGKDIYEILLGRKPKYSDAKDQAAAIKALQDSGDRGLEMMVFNGGGVNGSGVMNAAQLGGYDLGNVILKGQTKPTRSLKGLVLSDGYVVKRDIAFVESPHPTYLSNVEMESPGKAAEVLKKKFSVLYDLKKSGWKVHPDMDDAGQPMRNLWDEGIDYRYGRADIRPGYFEFGAPDDRRAAHASASRLDPQTIVAGSRDRVQFDEKAINRAKFSKPSSPKNPLDLWSVRPRQPETRYIFDRGPGKDIAKLLMENLNRDLIFEPKPGMKVLDKRGRDITFETHGIDAYNTKTYPDTGFFGLHRGDFKTSKALILADPHGLDDWNTSRAMTGARGQYLNGMMTDLGYNEDYLVLKTVPVGMDGATDEEWEVVRKNTETYREVAIKKALENPNIETIFTDGKVATAEMKRILEKLGVTDKLVIDIARTGMDPASGITEALVKAKTQIEHLATPGRWSKLLTALKLKNQPHMQDIPRSHLTWWSRIWEGTGGDLVVDAKGAGRGGVRALVAPSWVAKQVVQVSPSVEKSISTLRGEMGVAKVINLTDKNALNKDGNFFKIEEERQKTFKLKAADFMKFRAEMCGGNMRDAPSQ